MDDLLDLLTDWIGRQRWYGGKGRGWADVEVSGFFLERESPVLSVHRMQITYTGGDRET